MTFVFVHGVPESAAIWDPLVAATRRRRPRHAARRDESPTGSRNRRNGRRVVGGAPSLDDADRFGAVVLTLEDHGHWWMGAGPAEAAAGLVEFWSGLG